MMLPADPQKEKVAQLARRVDELRQVAQQVDPFVLAAKTGTAYHAINPGEGAFRLQFWGQDIEISYPGLVARKPEQPLELPVDVQALVAYHFTTADGAPLTGRWIAFSELPGGRFYAPAYHSYSGGALVRAFDSDLAAFKTAATQAGGKPVSFADAAFAFAALPRLHLLAAYWLGDEDFPSSAQILFDANAPHHLPADVCAILGGMLAGKIVRAKR